MLSEIYSGNKERKDNKVAQIIWNGNKIWENVWDGNQPWDREIAKKSIPEKAVLIDRPDDIIKASIPYCQTAHCGRGKSHFIFGGLASPIVPYRNLTQTTDGITADCRSLV